MTNHLIDQAITVYEETRNAGRSLSYSRKHALDRVPALRPLVTPGPNAHLSMAWRHAIAAAEERRTHTNGNGSRHGSSRHDDQATLFPTTRLIPAPFNRTAAELSAYLFDAWAARRGKVTPGDHFTFSPKQLADLYAAVNGRHVTSINFVNTFLNGQNGRLIKAGYAFETINASHETYTVKITAIPAPPAPPEPAAPPPPAPGLTHDELATLKALLAKLETNS